MEKIKEYNIKTMEDFFNVVDEENYENFVTDFLEIIETVLSVKIKIKESTGEYPKSICKEFIWKDDSIRGVNKIVVTNPETGESKTYEGQIKGTDNN